ncbi:MAG: hypothetical protein B6241_03990 [Spirochaetaceae bacterium 4572_59]|nr:MAG: hypothetical protein B6241_03990 [Spirochaetaceae bacterium 4572_59]
MKDKNPLFQLKNNSKGKQKLQRMINDREILNWLKDLFLHTPMIEENAKWKSLLMKYEEELLLLASDSDPGIRYHALSVLIYSDNKIADRLIWDSLDDSDSLVRILLLKRFKPEDRQKFYNRLYRIYLKDSNWKVRKASRERIRKDYSDLFTISPDNLEEREKIHCIELLDHRSSMDHDLAIHFLQDNKKGIALNASLYLEKEGCLDDMLKKASLSDMDEFNRKKELLLAAVSCQVSSFLDKKENFMFCASLCLGIGLLHAGAISKITEFIIEKVIVLPEKSVQVHQIRLQALEILLRIKTTEAYELLRKILKNFKSDNEIIKTVLEKLPEEGALNIYPVLLEYLKDLSFSNEETLIMSFMRLPMSYCLKDMYTIVRDTESDLIVKRRALSVLCQFSEESTILFILEQLPLFSREDIQELGSTALKWAPAPFIKTAGELFQECDGNVRKSLMTLSALAGITRFLPEMEESLTDADPENRKTAIRALIDLDNSESLDKIINLLYDPDALVRSEAARSLIKWNKEEAFHQLSQILGDPNEVDTVEISIIEELGESSNIKSIALLIPVLELKTELEDELIKSLMHKKKDDEIREIVGFFVEGTSAVRSSLTKLFSRMGDSAESYLLELLRAEKEIALHPSISRILDETAYVDLCISKLKNRKKSIRKQAAEDLILIGTEKAWQGLIIAVKDISREIRIISIRAMEKLRNNDSEKILEGLKNDPDKKVRKYTLWALEKINAGKLP